MKRISALLLCMGMLLSGLPGCQTAGTQSSAPAVDESASTETVESSVDSISEPPEPASQKVEEEEEPVNNDWEFATPESRGADNAYFEAIHRKIANSQMLAVVTVKDGVVIDEFYQDGYDENSVFGVHSVTKSVMGSLIGIAIEQGTLAGVDTGLSTFFPQIADSDDARKQEITLEHLLTHTSGIGWPASEFNALVNSENWVEYTLELPMAAQPGTSFVYTTAGSHMLSAVLEQATGIPTRDYAEEYLFGPIGIESAQWDQDPQGVTDGGNGLHLSVRDMARFGQLFLDEGNWRGQQIVPQSWVEVSTREHAAGEPDKGTYGYQWWIRSFGKDGAYSGYYALGYAGQFVFVVPELNLVTAITSKSVWSDYTGQVCFNEIVAAFA